GDTDVHRVLFPLSRIGPTQKVAAAGIVSRAEINRIGTKLTDFICGGRIVVRNAFTAEIVVLELKRSGDGLWLPVERRISARLRGRKGQIVEVAYSLGTGIDRQLQ